MIAALTPLASWLVFGGAVAIGVTVYVVVAGGHRYRRMERELEVDRAWRRMVPTVPVIRVLGGVYDHEARGDFDR